MGDVDVTVVFVLRVLKIHCESDAVSTKASAWTKAGRG